MQAFRLWRKRRRHRHLSVLPGLQKVGPRRANRDKAPWQGVQFHCLMSAEGIDINAPRWYSPLFKQRWVDTTNGNRPLLSCHNPAKGMVISRRNQLQMPDITPTFIWSAYVTAVLRTFSQGATGSGISTIDVAPALKALRIAMAHSCLSCPSITVQLTSCRSGYDRKDASWN